MKFALVASTFLAVLASASPVDVDAAPKKCPKCTKICLGLGQVCVSLPTKTGCKDICVLPVFCGGFAGIPCKADGDYCVDDPRDSCDPKQGGADCGGLCIPKRLLG